MRNQSAFSLLEIMVVFTVLSVLSTMVLGVYREQDYSKKTEETRLRLDRLEGALANYRNTHHRLPCPANPALKPGDTGYGYEGQNPGNCTDGSPATSFIAGNTVAGMIPVRTMQLPDEMAYDAWGRRFTYAVDRRMTHIQAAFKYGAKNCDIGAITVNDASGNARTAKAIYALVSHGENGHGAYLSSGQVRNAKSTNANELTNADFNSATFVMRRETRASASLFNRFDDLLRYKERWAMVNAVDVVALKKEMGKGDYFVSVVVGETHTCSLTHKGRVFCWGYNSSGELGDNTTTNRLIPVETVMPSGVSAFTAVTTKDERSCALSINGEVYCWGKNNRGQIGDNSTTNRSVPTRSRLPAGVIASAFTMDDENTCALDDAGKIYCWGSNTYGQIGDNSVTDRHEPKLVSMPPGVTFTALHSDDRHNCALANTGAAYCWGNNTYGQLGDNSTTQRRVPTLVTMPPGVIFQEFTLTSLRTCATGHNGTAYCWGDNYEYSLGDNTNIDRRVPTAVVMPVGVVFTRIFADDRHTCALSNTGASYCWGSNHSGQVGDNSTTQRRVPTASLMPAGVSFSTLELSANHICALAGNEVTYCWGDNGNGQVGDGTTTQRRRPVAVQMPTGVSFTSISSDDYHTCATGENSKVYCWGKNSEGQLGDGSANDRNAPVVVDFNAPGVPSLACD